MAEEKKSSGLALAGLILGIIAVVLAFVPFVNFFAIFLAILGLIFGSIGLSQTKSNKQTGKGQAVTAVVLSIIAIVISLLMYFLVFAAVNTAINSINKDTAQANNQINDASGSNTNKILADDLAVKIGKFSATTDKSGLTSTELPVNLTNKTSQKLSFSVEVEAVDASGKRIDSDTVYANSLGAKQSQDLKAFQLVTSDKLQQVENATFKIVTVSKY